MELSEMMPRDIRMIERLNTILSATREFKTIVEIACLLPKYSVNTIQSDVNRLLKEEYLNVATLLNARTCYQHPRMYISIKQDYNHDHLIPAHIKRVNTMRANHGLEPVKYVMKPRNKIEAVQEDSGKRIIHFNSKYFKEKIHETEEMTREEHRNQHIKVYVAGNSLSLMG